MESCSLEIKHTRGKSYFNFSEFKNEQIAYARMISSEKGCLIRVQGVQGEPDYLYMSKAPAYIVIRYPKAFYVIPVSDMVHEMKTSDRKSLTEQRAIEISINTTHILNK